MTPRVFYTLVPQTIKAFLPSMMSRNQGHVVTIASAAGYFGVSGAVDYCTSKFAAVGLDESVRAELWAKNKTGVRTTVVCPYLINTGMFEGCTTRSAYLVCQFDWRTRES